MGVSCPNSKGTEPRLGVPLGVPLDPTVTGPAGSINSADTTRRPWAVINRQLDTFDTSHGRPGDPGDRLATLLDLVPARYVDPGSDLDRCFLGPPARNPVPSSIAGGQLDSI